MAPGALPWWARNDEAENPQGARWQHDVAVIEPRLREHGLWDRQDELERVSYQQALLHRKFTLEMVRTYAEISGYVITGERDTPISKAGMWTGISEGAERMKFDPSAFAAFNQDVVLSLGWDKRRAWINGGDRAAWWDTFSYVAGQTVRAHMIASNCGATASDACLEWRVDLPSGTASPEASPRAQEKPWSASSAQPNAAQSDPATASPRSRIRSGEAVPLAPGDVREVGIAEFSAPAVDRPVKATLEADVRIGEEAWSRNEWPIWFFPAPPAEPPAVRLFDPAGRLDTLGPWLRPDNAPTPDPAAARRAAGQIGSLAPVTLATAWSDDLRGHVESGGRAILLQAGGGPPGPIATTAMPFWREAIKLIEPHPAWGDFPHEGFCDLQFFGMATDYALDSAKLPGARPILRRVDARTAAVHDYAVELEIGAGRLIVSTLRFEGGLGEQPVGLSRNTAAAYLLACWVRYLGA